MKETIGNSIGFDESHYHVSAEGKKNFLNKPTHSGDLIMEQST